MVAAWSDTGSFESESEDEERAKLCLMVIENARENDESEEVTLEYGLTFTKSI